MHILLVPVDRAARRFLTVVQSLKTHASGVLFKLLFICDSAHWYHFTRRFQLKIEYGPGMFVKFMKNINMKAYNFRDLVADVVKNCC